MGLKSCHCIAYRAGTRQITLDNPSRDRTRISLFLIGLGDEIVGANIRAAQSSSWTRSLLRSACFRFRWDIFLRR